MSSLLDALNPQHRAFVEQYLASPTLNAQDAAIAAGYSPKRAKSQACHMLQRPDVKAAVAAGIAARSERTQITADALLEHLSQKAKADLADIYMPDGRLKPVHEWPLIWRQGLIAGVKTAETDEAGVTVREVKIADRTKVDELIGKHVGVQAFREKVEHSGPGGSPIQYEDVSELSDTQRAARLAAILDAARARRDGSAADGGPAVDAAARAANGGAE